MTDWTENKNGSFQAFMRTLPRNQAVEVQMSNQKVYTWTCPNCCRASWQFVQAYRLPPKIEEHE